MKFFKINKTKRWLKKLPKRVSSSAMLLENSVGQVLIVKANYKSYWTVPGGIIDPHETPREGAIRETFEEIGVKVTPAKVVFVAVVDRRSDFAETFQFIFKAPLEPGMSNTILLQATEIDKYALVTREQVLSNDREYGKVIQHWATNTTGYIEQTFGKEVVT